jgi:hypothetical protein
MPKVKKIDEKKLADKTDEIAAVGEMIREKEEEKQAAVDEFGKEKKRYDKGEVSEETLQSTAKKTTTELKKVDKEIKGDIKKVEKIADDVKEFVKKEKPQHMKASEGGVKSGQHKKK